MDRNTEKDGFSFRKEMVSRRVATSLGTFQLLLPQKPHFYDTTE